MRFIGIAVLYLFPLAAKAQLNVTVQTKAGFLIPHHSTMRSLMNHVQSVEVSALYTIDTSHIAAKNLRRPGVGFVMGAIHNNKQRTNGNILYLGLMAEKNLILRKNARLGISFATGFGYLTKRFDEETNRQNIAIGSHVNGLMQIGLKQYVSLNRKTEFRASLDLTHFSNGNLRMPNLGFNFRFRSWYK